MDLNSETCNKARLARDHRFDGLFFTAVKTTKIYCRSICPAPAPLEKNVEYFGSAIEAAQAGYRPCLRCRPDSAPGSPAWQGKNTSFNRASTLIQQGALEESSLEELSDRLGISSRYLRKLFSEHIGMGPKEYALYQQSLFAKSLLHQTTLPITDIAYASGFNSVRRFNDCFKKLFSLTPSDIRRSTTKTVEQKSFNIKLSYRPPYNWEFVHGFLQKRIIPSLEWLDDNSYGRNFVINKVRGSFTATIDQANTCFDVAIQLDDIKQLRPAILQIRRVLDLDADIQLVESNLLPLLKRSTLPVSGLRLPNIWSPFEAGIRAILGQQVSVTQAHKMTQQLVDYHNNSDSSRTFFPEADEFKLESIDALKMPGSRKNTLKSFVDFCQSTPKWQADELLPLKGFGPWTVNYIKMRGFGDPDVFLTGDIGVKHGLKKYDFQIDAEKAAPWKSYLTLHLWSLL